MTRGSSLNRYAYVEGAPESYVDVLGFYRARAAIRAQELAAFNAAFDESMAALQRMVSGQLTYGKKGGGGQTVDEMMAFFNQFGASSNPAVRAAMDSIARSTFQNVYLNNYQKDYVHYTVEEASALISMYDEAYRQRQIQAIQAQFRSEQEDRNAEYASYGLLNLVTDVQEVVPEIGNNIRWGLNMIRPDNLVFTLGSWGLAELSGADCVWDNDEKMIVCGGASYPYFSGGNVWGATFVTDTPLVDVLEDVELLKHEGGHLWQEAIFGSLYFYALYGVDSGVAWATTGDASCGVFEDWAGFEEGGYEQCM